jgi:tetratricopeptide (TPR) repeat protein
MKIIIFKITLICFLFMNFLHAKSDYFSEGVNLYKKEKFKDAQFKFEQEIVFNPKSELSYLYLSKIFNKLDKKDLEEQNLNTVMLLNPKNEEAIYNLAKLKLASSDYKKSKELNNRLSSICSKFCNKNSELKIEIENLSKK